MGKPARQGRGRAYISNSAAVGRMWLHRVGGITHLQEEPCAGRSNLQERVVLVPSKWHAVLSSHMHAGVAVTVRVSELDLRSFLMFQAVRVEPWLVHGRMRAFAFGIASTSSNLACAPSQWRCGCFCAGTVSQGSLAHSDGRRRQLGTQ
jgi:hypothetical protein